MDNLNELFMHELKDIYDAEHQLATALPMMAAAATAFELREAFHDHLQQTNHHIERLNQVFQMMGASPERKTCDGMKGLIKESEKVMEEKMASDVRDAALIASAQRAEHYEIAGYGTLRTYARVLGHNNAAELLQQTLDEEAATDEKLTVLAGKVNHAARA